MKIYGVTNSTNGGNSYFVNKSTGESTLLGYSGANTFSAIKANPKSGIIFGFKQKGVQTELYKMDGNSGRLYNRSLLDIADVYSCSFDTSGKLFLLSKRNILYSYDEVTNTLSRIDSIASQLSSIAFDPFTNQLFGAIYKPLGAGKDYIVKVNIATGDTIRVGQLGSNKPIRDIFFDETGKLFGFVGASSSATELVSIDKFTGLGTLVGSTGLNGLVSVAYYPGIINSVNENDPSALLNEYKLYDNYPNPFNPSTIIRYALPVSGNVTLRVYNLQGEVVQTLVSGWQDRGDYSIQFPQNGISLSSSVYFYELQAGDVRILKKMVLLK
jgi:hypothetical protein